jgi:pantoate--beta-alanine ligase
VPELIETIEAIRGCVHEWKSAGLQVGFVPTMGALHAGHGALMERARKECDRVVASIFVNPTQFNDPVDFERYTRDLASDLSFCDRHGVAAVFAPPVAEMYSNEGQSTWIEVSDLSAHLCGPLRPGHFRGVATVVAKLLNIVSPHRAYFGQKDAQQLAVIRTMVNDLNIPVEIVPVPTVRESDGLALSSRNARLSADERSIAPLIYRALQAAEATILNGETDKAVISSAGLAVLAAHPALRVEYFEVVDAHTMKPVATITAPVCIATAAWLGSTRLIDNVLAAPAPVHQPSR